MADPQHVEWLLEGVDSWNAKRVNGDVWDPDFSGADLMTIFRQAGKIQPNEGVLLNGPNLDGVDLTSANLSGVKLNHASLKDARLTRAILRDGSFPGSSFVGANVAGANLSNADLYGADFRNAKLQMANLSGGNLQNAKLQNANLAYADLSHANLDSAKLNGTNLLGAILTDASLHEAELLSAHLFATVAWWPEHQTWKPEGEIDLTVHSFATVAWWPEHQTWKPEGEIDLTVHSIEGLWGVIRKIKTHYESFPSDVFLYFRGDARCDWDLCPSIMRKIQQPVAPPFWKELVSSGDMNSLGARKPDELQEFAQYMSDFARWYDHGSSDLAPRAFERDMLVELMARRPEEFSSMPSALAKWMLAQHHGLQTRFLDVTKNLLVASHFACDRDRRHNGRIHVFAVPKTLVKPFNSDAISIVANLARLEQGHQQVLLNRSGDSPKHPTAAWNYYHEALRLLYQLIREEKPNFEKRIDPRDFYRVFVVEPQQLSERLRAQSGAFLVSAFHENFKREKIVASNSGIPIYDYYAITIPSAAKANFLNDLPLMDTTSEKLFPGLDSSASAVLNEFGLRRPPNPSQR